MFVYMYATAATGRQPNFSKQINNNKNFKSHNRERCERWNRDLKIINGLLIIVCGLFNDTFITSDCWLTLSNDWATVNSELERVW